MASSGLILTVIIAVKNKEEELFETLKSLAKVECVDPIWEVILVNGGSEVHPKKLMPYTMISYVITEQDSGIYDAWNKGIKKASGQYIAFLGAGDKVRKDYLAVMASVAKSGGLDLIICSQQHWLQSGKPLRKVGSAWSWNQFKKFFSIPHIGIWHKASLFKTFGLFDTSFIVSGDYEWLLRVGRDINVYSISEVLLDVPVGGLSDKGDRVFLETRRARSMHTNASSIDLYGRDFAYRIRKKIRQWIWG